VLLPGEVDEADTVAEWLRQAKGRKVELLVPRRGEKRRIVELATKNARDTLEQQKAEWAADSEKAGEAALQLQEALNLPRTPRRIECYDISHVQGTSQVASMVVFEDGKAKRSDYKRFKIKHQEGNNDFLSMQEVVRRRFTRALAATPGTERMGAIPEPDAFRDTNGSYAADLAVEPYPHADGAAQNNAASLEPAGQPGSDEAAVRRAGLPLPVMNGGPGGLTFRPTIEDDETAAEDARSRLDGGLEAAYADTHGSDEAEGQEQANGSAAAWGLFPDLVIIDGGKGQLSAAVEVMDSLELSEIPIVGLAKEREELFQKHRSDPVLLPRNSQALYLVQRVRDEAHRFAITYHRKVRGKESLRSQLDDVPGVGPTRKKALIRHFGSVKAIRGASVEELAAVPGMTKRTAEELKRALAE